MLTSNLRLNISINNKSTNCEINIRLDDECENGHEDFAITGTFWTPGKPRIDRYHEMGGCCHDEIIKIRPDLAQFVALHLCDANGAPMYAVENGLYHLKQDKQVAAEYLRCTPEEIQVLDAAEDKAYFTYLVSKIGLPERWKAEAEAATLLLESIINEHFPSDDPQKFKSTAVKSNFAPLSDAKTAEIEKLISDGYYTPEAIAARKEEAHRAKIEKRRNQLTDRLNDRIRKERTKTKIDILILDTIQSIKDNFIYYDHTNTLKFNWLDYSDKFTQEEIHAVMEKRNQFPKGINFEF